MIMHWKQRAAIEWSLLEFFGEGLMNQFPWDMSIAIRPRWPELSDEFYEFKRDAWLYPEYSRKLFKYFFARINSGPIKYYDKFIHVFLAIENNPRSKSGVHIHGLIHGIHPHFKDLLEQDCRKFFGQTKIKDIHDQTVPYIIEKYCWETMEDYRPIKINSKYRKPYLGLSVN